MKIESRCRSSGTGRYYILYSEQETILIIETQRKKTGDTIRVGFHVWPSKKQNLLTRLDFLFGPLRNIKYGVGRISYIYMWNRKAGLGWISYFTCIKQEAGKLGQDGFLIWPNKKQEGRSRLNFLFGPVRNRKASPGYISYLRMGAVYVCTGCTNFSMTALELIFSHEISAWWLFLCSFP